jgi:hypothetical protein
MGGRFGGGVEEVSSGFCPSMMRSPCNLVFLEGGGLVAAPRFVSYLLTPKDRRRIPTPPSRVLSRAILPPRAQN